MAMFKCVEVARLELDDIEWHRGEIKVRGKSRRIEAMQPPAEVGDAIATHLRDARPPTRDRHTFQTNRAPIRGVPPDLLIDVVRRACSRAGLPPAGAHRLRHSLATGLLVSLARLMRPPDCQRVGDPSLTVEVGGQVVEPAEVLWKLLWARYDSRPGLTRRTLTLVQVQGLRGDEVVSTGTVYDDHSMVRTTGLGAASAVLQLLRDPALAGAWGTEVLDPIPTLDTFGRLASSIGAVPQGVRFDTVLSSATS